MSQKYVEIWEASKSSRNVLNLRMYWQLKVYTWIFLIGFGCWGVLNTSNDFFQFQTNLAFALANSLWLSPETINALEKLNEAFFEINDKITDNIVDNIKIGQEYYHQLAKLRIEIENCLKNDMLSLYKVHKFLKLKTIHKDRIFNIAK